MARFNIRIEGTLYYPNRWNEIKCANILELFCLQWEPAPLAAEGLKARFDKLLRSSSKPFRPYAGSSPLRALPCQTAPHSSRALPARKAPNLIRGAPSAMPHPQA